MTWLWLFIAFWCGVYVGIFLLAMCNVASAADAHVDRMDGEW